MYRSHIYYIVFEYNVLNASHYSLRQNKYIYKGVVITTTMMFKKVFPLSIKTFTILLSIISFTIYFQLGIQLGVMLIPII